MVVGHVLVTGAGGFVGRALCPYLEAQGFAVRRAGRTGEALIRFIGPLTDWRDALAGIDAVVHLAGMAHVPASDDPERALDFQRVNVDGTRALAEQAAQAGVKRFILLSSATVMGIETDRPLTEHDEPKPENAYARSKLAAERLLKDIAEPAGMGWLALRPPLIYGPGVKANFRLLMRLARSGLPLPFARIDNRRDLLYLGNLCDAIAACLRAEPPVSGVFFLTDGAPVSTPQLLRELAQAEGRRARLLPVPPRLLKLAAHWLGCGGMARRLMGSFLIDDGAFRRAYGWQPPFSRQEGLRETVKPQIIT